VSSIHVTVASAIFILSSLVGLWYSVGVLPRYVATYRATKKVLDDGDRRLAAGLHFEIMAGEIIRCTLHTLFLVAGIWSLTIPPAPLHPESINQRWFGAYFLWMLVAANIGLTANTLTVRRGYRRRRGEPVVKVLPSREKFAAVLMEVRNLKVRMGVEERRNDAIEDRANAAHQRADLAESDLVNHEERISTTEDVLEIKHTITKKTDGSQ
jgi:hypothetical protein